MRGTSLILRNSFRNTFRHPTKVIGLSALVALFALVLSLVININIRVVNAYNNLRDQSNLHNIVMPLDPFDRVPTGDTPGNEGVPTNLVAAQQYWLYRLQAQYEQDPNKSFYWSRTEGREFSQVSFGSNNLTLKVLAKVTPKNNLNNYPHGVDDLVIFNGRAPALNQGHEVVLDPIFAQKHNLKINDIIRIQADNFGSQILVDSPYNENIEQNFLDDLKKIRAELEKPDSKGINDPDGLYQKKYAFSNDWYQIVGLGGSVDFTMPILNQSTPVPNREKEALLYVDPSNFGLSVEGDLGLYAYNQRMGRLTVTSQTEWESFYSLANKNSRDASPQFIKQMNKDFQSLVGSRLDGRNYFYGEDDPDYRYARRTTSLEITLQYYSIGVSTLLILLIIVIIFSIVLVIEKLVDNSQGQVGILKSLGYTKTEIGFNYAMVAVFVSIIGGIIGFAVAIPVTNVLVREFRNYFVIDYGSSGFNWWAFVGAILAFFIFLNLVTFIVINVIVRRNTAELVSGQKNTKVSSWSQFWKEQVANRSFDTKLQTALLLRASGKMTLVGVIVFLASTLFTISFAGPDILRRNQSASFYGAKYKQLVEYVEPTYNNPFSFYKTFNIEANLEARITFEYSEELKKYVALPLTNSESQATGGYDLNKIASAYYHNTQSGEYYSLAIPGDGEGEIDVIAPNMRFLAGDWLAPSIEFYRFMSRNGAGSETADLFGDTLFRQWPAYVDLMNNLHTDDLKQNLKDMQYFYSSITNGIGLSLTKKFWSTNDDGSIPSESQKINEFNTKNENSPYPNSKEAASLVLNYDKSQFNPNLRNLMTSVSTDGEPFLLTNDNWGVGIYHIQPPQDVSNPKDYVDDYYSLMNVDSLDDKLVSQYLKQLMLWFGALIQGRYDQAIVQAAYSRPAYFVQQSMKNAYNSVDPQPYVPYFQAFGVIPYNNLQEQYGTLFRVNPNQDKKGEFKVYGIERNTPFLNLRNKKDQDLIQKLYSAQRPKVGNEIGYNIIVNQSVAKSLKLQKDSIVTWDVLQQELTDGGKVSDLNESWSIGSKPTKNKEFIQLNDISNGSWNFITSDGKKLPLNDVLSGLDDSVGAYYQEFLDGKLRNHEIDHQTKFKILDIHNGYGDQQAWIKNEDAIQILNFEPLKDFFWTNFFGPQWNETFAKKDLNLSFYQSPNFKANEIFNFVDSDSMKSYSEFLPLLSDSNPEIQNSAMIINQIFENSFPIFNYKYSNKADVGDLSNVVSVYQAYGDYSPIGMNGTTKVGTNVDGIAQGAIDNIVPISIKKAILDQISALVYLLMVLAIIAILIITFVIVLLTVNLIIDDNIEFIATLKVLGYSNNYIARSILSMYFIVIAFTFVLGLIVGWICFVAIIKAVQPVVVLPLTFPIWLPFAVALGVVGIYAITLAVGYWIISRTNPLDVLESQVK